MVFMTIRIRLFAMLRERAGSDSIELDLAEGATVGDALAALGRSGPLASALQEMPVRMAVNRDYAEPGTPLEADDELALIPPISGGAHLHARINDKPLSPDALSGAVAAPAAGAIVVFQGVTRTVERLDYEAYREMAEQQIERILAECIERHGLLGAAAEHRVGSVPQGDPAVVVAVAAAHREEAFAGAREAIDRIKAEAPIWKREVEAGGSSRWVEGGPPPSAAHATPAAAPGPSESGS
jgi:molybdopterin synthase catalytic subunit